MTDRAQDEVASDQSNASTKGAEPVRDQMTLLSDLAQHHAQRIASTHAELLQGHMQTLLEISPGLAGPHAADAYQKYLQDYAQRWILFLDTLRQRGNSYLEREKEGFKPALVFDYDVVIDGRKLERPVNYALVRIRPPEGFPPQREDSRPFVVIDPRAGHGSGIGGFKSDSEVGVALQDGFPVYFVIFFPEPEPGQTLADVCAAEAVFLKEVHERHPKAPQPLVIGNCQGGWAAMILSATHPGLSGPVVIAGAPLSYWAGKLGTNPFRYYGGIAGGSVPALLASDLGAGKFDGAGLVLNFEQLNPANTWWRKYYDLFADVDDRASEFLRFETWWSGFYFMNENEIRWIVENLFVGNKLTRGEAILSDGTPVDLSRIKAPVIVFASHGDNITPPQQALNWIPDLYPTTDDIRARGHVIIYTLHDSVGHLGIFVSAKVATKQHKQITSVVKTIEALAPGLYEMLIDEKDGSYEVAFETRAVEDILALDDGRDEEVEFAAVAKVSEWATHTYELTVRPAVKALVTPEVAKAMVAAHPARQQRYLFSDQNPVMSGVSQLAQQVRDNRARVDDTNPFMRMERLYADMVQQSLNFSRDVRDAMIELSFHGIYATPWMRSVAESQYRRASTVDVSRIPEVRDAVEHVEQGGYREAIIRILVLLAKTRGSVRRDRLERSNRLLQARPPFDTMKLDERTHMIHEQNLIVQFAPNEAIATLPNLLRDQVDRIRALDLVLDIAGPVDQMDAATISMFKRVQDVLATYARGWHQAGSDMTDAAPETPLQKPSTASPHILLQPAWNRRADGSSR